MGSLWIVTRRAYLHRFGAPRSVFAFFRNMSYQAAVSKLNSPVKELVLAVAGTSTDLAGTSQADEAEVASWIEKTSQGDLVKADKLKDLDTLLVPKTYIATNYFTVADVALYGALHSVVAKLQPSEYYAVPSVTRYFDHVQSNSSVRASAVTLGSAFPVIQFDLENAPAVERKAEPAKKKEKPKAATPAPDAAVAADTTPKATTPAETPKPSEEKPQKKEKKEKKKDAAAGETSGVKEGKKGVKAPAAPAADDGEPLPSMIDLRVGHIVDVKKHPDADGLYIEQIDLGEETGPRTVISGLVNYIPIEQMQDKWLVVVCNLKPANMRGVKSFGMVLAASSKEGKDGGLELIEPPANSKPGDRVYFEGEAYENETPLAQLNPKKKIFETIQPGFTTLETREAAWINPVTKTAHRIRTANGPCVAPTLVGASLS